MSAIGWILGSLAAVYAVMLLLIIGFGLVAGSDSPAPCGWPNCEAPQCQPGADEQEHEGERVRSDLGSEEPQQGDQSSGDVADECDHGPSLPRLRLV